MYTESLWKGQKPKYPPMIDILFSSKTQNSFPSTLYALKNICDRMNKSMNIVNKDNN